MYAGILMKDPGNYIGWCVLVVGVTVTEEFRVSFKLNVNFKSAFHFNGYSSKSALLAVYKVETKRLEIILNFN